MVEEIAKPPRKKTCDILNVPFPHVEVTLKRRLLIQRVLEAVHARGGGKRAVHHADHADAKDHRKSDWTIFWVKWVWQNHIQPLIRHQPAAQNRTHTPDAAHNEQFLLYPGGGWALRADLSNGSGLVPNQRERLPNLLNSQQHSTDCVSCRVPEARAWEWFLCGDIYRNWENCACRKYPIGIEKQKDLVLCICQDGLGA